MQINDIRRVLNGRADILKIQIMLQFFVHDLFFLIHTQSFKSIDSNECVDLCLFFGFFFNVYDQIPYYFASSINLININQLNLHWLARLSVLM